MPCRMSRWHRTVGRVGVQAQHRAQRFRRHAPEGHETARRTESSLNGHINRRAAVRLILEGRSRSPPERNAAYNKGCAADRAQPSLLFFRRCGQGMLTHALSSSNLHAAPSLHFGTFTPCCHQALSHTAICRERSSVRLVFARSRSPGHAHLPQVHMNQAAQLLTDVRENVILMHTITCTQVHIRQRSCADTPLPRCGGGTVTFSSSLLQLRHRTSATTASSDVVRGSGPRGAQRDLYSGTLARMLNRFEEVSRAANER